MSKEQNRITVCIGSECHLKGARQVVSQMQYLIKRHKLEDNVDLRATFCMGNCQVGVCVTVNGKVYSVTPATVTEFFQHEVLTEV